MSKYELPSKHILHVTDHKKLDTFLNKYQICFISQVA